MHLCDIVFPQNLTHLTYSIPDKYLPYLKTGQLVRAPLKGKIKTGVVLSCYSASTCSLKGTVSEIKEIVKSTTIFTPGMLKLLEWSADYYITQAGTMLKSMIFKEVLKSSKTLQLHTPKIIEGPFPSAPAEDSEYVEAILSSVKRGGFKAFLYHAVYERHEVGFIIEIAKKTDHLLILMPLVKDAENLYSYLKNSLSDRVCIYHSEMKKTEKTDSVEGIYSKKYDIVIGTRQAVFAPLFSPKLIIVTKEHSPTYKNEKTPQYHARDIAVKRGFIEDIPVLLTSVTPSLDSIFNAKKKKYTLLESKEKVHLPRISLINLKKDKFIAPFLSSKLLNTLKLLQVQVPEIRNQKSEILKPKSTPAAMVVIQRRGYSMLTCEDCGRMESCHECQKPLVFHKDEGMLCHICGYRKKTPESCPECGGFNLRHFGAGTERIEEELKKHLNINILRVDSDTLQKTIPESSLPQYRIIVGTLIKKRTPEIAFSLIAFLNPDIILNLPEVKASERLVQEVFSLREFLTDNGLLVLQTEIPWYPVYRFLKKWDYMSFAKNELQLRRKISMPPYIKLVSLYIYSKDPKSECVKNAGRITDILKNKNCEIQVIGPFSTKPRLKGYQMCFQVLLKDGERGTLKEYVKSIKGTVENSGMTLRIDVDPVFF